MLSSIIGHDSLKEKLSSRLEKDPYGTFLFHGPASVGKRTTAFETARVILCENKTGDDCICDSCKRFDKGHPDFLCIGQLGKIKVADVDKVIDFTYLSPFISDSKVVVIDNVHEITTDAANRLLKILEEPPEKFCFILVSAKPQFIIPTVLSRCIRYEFGNLSREDLTMICNKHLGFKSAESKLLAKLASGTSLEIFSKAGQYLKYRKMAYEFVKNIKATKLINSLDYIDKIEKSDLPYFIDMIVLILTDMVLLKNGITKITNDDKEESLIKFVEKLNSKALIQIMSVFSQCKRYAYLNVNLNLNLKSILIRTHPYFLLESE